MRHSLHECLKLLSNTYLPKLSQCLTWTGLRGVGMNLHDEHHNEKLKRIIPDATVRSDHARQKLHAADRWRERQRAHPPQDHRGLPAVLWRAQGQARSTGVR